MNPLVRYLFVIRMIDRDWWSLCSLWLGLALAKFGDSVWVTPTTSSTGTSHCDNKPPLRDFEPPKARWQFMLPKRKGIPLGCFGNDASYASKAVPTWEQQPPWLVICCWLSGLVWRIIHVWFWGWLAVCYVCLFSWVWESHKDRHHKNKKKSTSIEKRQKQEQQQQEQQQQRGIFLLNHTWIVVQYLFSWKWSRTRHATH